MASDINQIIDPKVIEDLKKMNEQLVAAGTNMDKLIPSISELNKQTAAASKNTGDNAGKQKQLTEAEKEAEKVKKQIVDVEKKIQQVSSEQNKRLVAVRAELQRATTAEKQLQRARDAQRGSIEQLSAVNSILEKRLKSVNLTTDEGRKKADLLRSAIDKNNVKIKENSSNLSAQRINIGNYASALDGVAGKFSMLPGPLGRAASGLATVGKAMWSLVANPIGAVIAALVATLTGLYKIFQSTDEGATTFAAVLKALGNVVDVVIDRLVSFSKMVFDLITFDFKGFKENAQSAFGGVGDALRDAALAGWEYEQVMDRIRDTESASLTRAAKLRKEIEELTVASKDRNLGAKEQIRLAELAMQKSIELNNIETGFSKQKTEATRNDLASKIQNDKLTIESKQRMLDEWLNIDDLQLQSELEKNKAFADFYNKNEADFQELQKMRAEDINKETGLITETRRLQTSLFTFKKEIYSEEAKLIEENKKKRAEFDKAILDGEEKRAKEELEIWAEQVNKKYELGLKQIELEKSVQETIARIRDEARKTEEQKADEEAEKILERIKKINEDEKKQKEETNKQLFDGGVTLANTLFDLKTSQLQREFEMAEGNAEKQAEINNKLAKTEKNKALFDIAINTATAIVKALPNIPLSILSGTIGAIQAGIVAAKPIPQFAKGTTYAPGGHAIVGEKGRELIKTPGGKVYLANNPALVNLERGSKVLTNRQTEAVLKDGNIVSELRQTRKAIQNIPQPVFLNGSKIAERRGNYWINYRNMKHRVN